MSDSEILIHVRDTQSGRTWDFRGDDGCPTIEQAVEGELSAQWTYVFTQGKDVLPPRHASVEIIDNNGTFFLGRVVRRQPPSSDQCVGPCTIAGEGMIANLQDQKGQTSLEFGPLPSPDVAVALTPEDAVAYAAGQLVPGLNINSVNLAQTGFVLNDSENFVGRTAGDVCRTMAAVGASLVTPIMTSVRNGTLYWLPLDLAPRFETLISDGAIVEPSDDAGRLYSRVIVIYGRNQTEVWPETISYQHLPTVVDLVVNAGSEVGNPAGALRLAQALYGRLDAMELGWSWTVRIPGGVKVAAVGSSPMKPWRVTAGQFLRVPDLDAPGRYGANHASPNELLITRATWNGPTNELVLSCGEIRDQTSFVRKVMSQASARGVVASTKLSNMSTFTRDMNKAPLVGPRLSTAEADYLDSSGDPKQTPVKYGIAAYDTSKEQFLITHESPKPIKIEKGAEQSATWATGLLDTGKFWSDVPPCSIDRWYLSGSPAGSLTVEVYTADKTAGGAYETDASGDWVPDTLVLTATLSNAKHASHSFSTALVGSNLPPRINQDSKFLYKFTQASSFTAWQITMNGNRIVPGHPEGFNTATPLGVRSKATKGATY